MFPLRTDVRRTPQVLRLFVRSGALEFSVQQGCNLLQHVL